MHLHDFRVPSADSTMLPRTLALLSLLFAPAPILYAGCTCGPHIVEEQPPPPDAAARYAEAICAAHERCGCMGEGFSSMDECTNQSTALFQTIADLPGMSFDLDCFEEMLTHFETEGCGGLSAETAVPCLTFTGTRGVGQACEPDWLPVGMAGGLTNGQCRGDALCAAGVCARPPPRAVGEGEACYLSLGVSCAGSELYCSREGRCASRVGDGEACDSPGACSIGLYCAGAHVGGDTPGVCRDRIGVGEPCDPNDIFPCAVGRDGYCASDGVCIDRPWPALCEFGHPIPGWYIAPDWIPTQGGG